MRLALLSLFALVGCDSDGDVTWRQFNGAEDEVEIEVAPGEASGVATFDLTSNTGVVVVGQATVTPATGPVGTQHTLVVVVDEEWGERIGRATINSVGERGEESYDLLQDTAEPGVFELVLTSLGEVDESRVDTWRLDLWEPIDAPLPEFEEES